MKHQLLYTALFYFKPRAGSTDIQVMCHFDTLPKYIDLMIASVMRALFNFIVQFSFAFLSTELFLMSLHATDFFSVVDILVKWLLLIWS